MGQSNLIVLAEEAHPVKSIITRIANPSDTAYEVRQSETAHH